jgi:hypothetical protein
MCMIARLVSRRYLHAFGGVLLSLVVSPPSAVPVGADPIKCFVTGTADSQRRHCSDFSAPKRLAVGEKFTAEGRERTIAVVQAFKHSRDYPMLGIRAGGWSCAASEDAAQIPAEDGRQSKAGTWLYVQFCQPEGA